MRKLRTADGPCIALLGLAAITLTSSAAFAAKSASVPLQIRSQELGSALTDFARQAGRQMLFDPGVVRGKRVRSLSGVYQPEQALRQLLVGTGLSYRETRGGAYLLVQAEPSETRTMVGAPRIAASAQPEATDPVPAAPPPTGSDGAGEVARPADDHDVIVVTAQKRVERLSDVPLSVTAVSGERLLQLGVSGPADLEKVALGFTYRPSAQGSPIFQIRGIGFFEEAIGVAPTVSVYLDQAPLPFSSMAEGVAFDLERVEVLKGPQGTLFGQNVTGGAINYIAAKPTSTLRAGIDAGTGRFDAIELGGFVSGPLSSTLRARLAGRIERRGDWQRTYTRVNEAGLYVVDTGAPHRSLGERRFENGRLLLNWKPSDRLDFLLNLNGWSNRSDSQAQQFHAVAPDTPGNVGGVPFWRQFESFPSPPPNNRYADWDPDRTFKRDDRFYQTSLRVQYALGDAIELTSLTSYSDLEASRPVDNDGTPLPHVYIVNGGRLKSFSQELRLAGSLAAERLRWMLGGNYAHDDTEELQDISFVATNTSPFFTGAAQDMASKARTWSAFGSVDYRLTSTLTAQGSLRYTKQKRDMAGCTRDPGDGTFGNFVAAAFGLPPIAPGGCITIDPTTFQTGLVDDRLMEDNLAWRASLDWKPMPDLMLYANATKGFKAGNFVNITALFANSLEPVPQEVLISYEAGFKVSAMQRRLQLTGAAFYYDYKNKQLTGFRDSVVFGIINSVVSVPKSRIIGAEIEAIARPIEGLTFRGGVTHIASKVTGDFLALDSGGTEFNRRGESFPGTPKWAAIGDVEYEFPVAVRWSGFLGGNAAYRSDSRTFFGDDPLYEIPSYTLVDLRAGVRSRDDRYRLQVYGRNIFDKFYVVTAQGQADNVTRITGMPATYGVTFSARY